MKEHGVEWESKNNTNKHLSVLDFKKQEREKELKTLDKQLEDKKDILSDIEESEKDTRKKIPNLDEPQWQLPPPSSFMSARNYHQKLVIPFINTLSFELKRLGKIATGLLAKNRKCMREIAVLQAALEGAIQGWKDATKLHEKLFGKAEKYNKIRKIIGAKEVDKMLLAHDEQNKQKINTNKKIKNKGDFSL